MGETLQLSPVGEGNAAGVEHRRGDLIPGTVLSVTHQGISPAGKLHPDLMAAACVQADPHKTGLSLGKPGKFQPGSFYACALPLYYIDLVLSAVFE